MPIVIRNGTVVTSTDQFNADILCDGGTIKAIGKNLDVPAGTEVVDASGQYVFPGGIDAHTHMELPFMGTTASDDFFTGTAAGVAGGTTSIIDFIIPNRNQSLLEARDFWFNNAKKAVSDYAFHMAVTWFSDQVRNEMQHVHKHDGIQSFKIFMAYRGAIGVDDVELVQVLDTAHSLGALVTSHCEHGDAVVALPEGTTAGADELVAHAADSLARYKLPKAVVFRPVIERSPSGKADYRWAREQAVNG